MAFDIKDISTIIQDEIKRYGKQVVQVEQGTIITVGDGVALIYGLDNAMMGELLIFPNNVYGMVLNLEANAVGAVILGDDSLIKEGDEVQRSKLVVETPVGDELLGRVINSLGQPIDGLAPLKTTIYRPVEKKATGVMSRKSIDAPLKTGILSIDSMVPIGKGQRELIIGDRQTGKTAIAVDAIINQKGKNVKCVYVAIGQKDSTIAQISEKLSRNQAMDYTVIVNAGASQPAPMQYLAPYTGITIAEEWMNQGQDVLIVYDDLSKHAVAYREMSLLLKRPSGREAYPGDIFYLHSRLLERAAKLNDELGGGSITALPIVETQAGDISAYIPTNVISITDGQIFLSTQLFNSGFRPAINSGLSVSRVGSAAQTKLLKSLSGTLKIDLAQYAELQGFTKFGADLDSTTQTILNHGARVTNVMKQKQYHPYSEAQEAILLLAIKEGLIDWLPVDQMDNFKEELLNHFNNKAKAIFQKVEQSDQWNEPLKKAVIKEIGLVIKQMSKSILYYDPLKFGSQVNFAKLGEDNA